MVYLRLAPYALILLLALGLFWYRGQAIAADSERDKANAALATTLAANALNMQTIERLTALRRQSDEILQSVNIRLGTINAATAETNETVNELERTNADVKAYLSGTIPLDLKRVLNRKP